MAILEINLSQPPLKSREYDVTQIILRPFPKPTIEGAIQLLWLGKHIQGWLPETEEPSFSGAKGFLLQKRMCMGFG